MTDLTPEAVKAALKCASVAHIAPDLAREYLRLKEVEKAAKEAYETEMLTGGGSPEAWALHLKAVAAFRAAVEGK